MTYYGITNTGLVRSNNEDNFATVDLASNACLLVVCDGMGGLSFGEEASRIAIDTFINKVKSSVSPFISGDKLSLLGDNIVSNMLLGAVASANTRVIKRAGERNESIGVMGSTLVGIMVIDNTAFIINIGDSRAYLMSDEALKQITRDHSYVRMLLDDGLITDEQAKIHPKRNVITRAIGVSYDVEPDLYKLELCKGCRVLLCSDGLTGYFDTEGIAHILKTENDLRKVCDDLVTGALAGGGGDNITAVVLDC